MSNTPLRVSSDDWAEFVNAGMVLLEESKMSDEIEKQEDVVLAAFSEAERIAEEAEAKMMEWDILRDRERKAFDAWRVELRLLCKMKGRHNEQR